MSCPTWKLILDYVSAGTYMYRVSDEGSVESRWDNRCIGGVGNKWKPLRAVPNTRGGYLVVTLCGSGKREQRRVADLVLEAFVGPRPPGTEACHDPDRSPSNNRRENLRWGTRQENVDDMMRHGTHYTPFARPPKLSLPQQEEIRRRYASGEPARSLGPAFGISHSTASLIIARKGVYAEEAHGV